MSSWIYNESGEIGTAGMENNANIVNRFFTANGWTPNAIAGILGNMQPESGINPARWENDDVGNLSAGFGLVQWTPSTVVRDWIDGTYGDGNYNNGDYQLARIIYERLNGLQYSPTKGFPESFGEWSVSDKQPGYLAAAFLCNYERAADTGWKAQMSRARIAEKWYKYLTGQDPKKWLPPGFIVVMKKCAERR